MKKLLAIIALCIASVAAYFAGGPLAVLGDIFYLCCIVAIYKDFSKVRLMLWFAVGVQALFVGYMVYDMQVNNVIPCPYCLITAGWVLIAAVVQFRATVIVLPLTMMVLVWYAWPWITPQIYTVQHERNRYEWVQPIEHTERPKAVDNIESQTKVKSDCGCGNKK